MGPREREKERERERTLIYVMLYLLPAMVVGNVEEHLPHPSLMINR